MKLWAKLAEFVTTTAGKITVAAVAVVVVGGATAGIIVANSNREEPESSTSLSVSSSVSHSASSSSSASRSSSLASSSSSSSSSSSIAPSSSSQASVAPSSTEPPPPDNSARINELNARLSQIDAEIAALASTRDSVVNGLEPQRQQLQAVYDAAIAASQAATAKWSESQTPEDHDAMEAARAEMLAAYDAVAAIVVQITAANDTYTAAAGPLESERARVVHELNSLQ